MVKRLDDLAWRRMWISHLGCIKGCLEYLNVDVSDAWLFGASGYAFIINMHESVCPSGPTAWSTDGVFELVRNAGCSIERVFALNSDEGFAQKQKQVWDATRKAIDGGVPCYGWELGIPEYYVLYGYDGTGYFYRGPMCEEGTGPKPWKELGCRGMLEVCSVRAAPASDDAKTVREALSFALAHAENPPDVINERYKSGLAGYDSWIHALETGNAIGIGMAYNSAAWHECRHHAAEFLREAKRRIPGGARGQGGRAAGAIKGAAGEAGVAAEATEAAAAFDEAAERYGEVAARLKTVAGMFPFQGHEEHVKDRARCSEAARELRAAREAEAGGLAALRGIVESLATGIRVP